MSSVVVAYAALRALSTWRKELTGKAQFDIARNVALLVHKIIEDFRWARFPVTSPAEAIGRERDKDETTAEAQTLDQWYIKESRLAALREDLPILQTSAWEAKMLLGEDAGEVVTKCDSDVPSFFWQSRFSRRFIFPGKVHTGRKKYVECE